MNYGSESGERVKATRRQEGRLLAVSGRGNRLLITGIGADPTWGGHFPSLTPPAASGTCIEMS